MNNLTLGVAIGAAVGVGVILGLWLRPFLFRPVLPMTLADVKRYMNGAVNAEDLEAQKRSRAIQLQRSGRRTIRTDGGPPAQVHRMRKRRKSFRPPTDLS